MQGLHLEQYDAFVRWHRTGGSGPPVIWLPGLCFSAVGNFLATVTAPVLQPWSAVMIDYPGSGTSDRPTGFDYSMDAHADCIAAVMDHLGLTDCPVVGYSMGGSVAMALAFRRPDLVSCLVIAEGNLTPGGGEATRAIAAIPRDEFVVTVFAKIMRKRRELAIAGNLFDAYIVGARQHVDPQALHATSTALVNLPANFESRFLALRVPRIFIYGEQNDPEGAGSITPDSPDPARLRAHGVITAVLQSTGHDLMLKNPDGFARLVAATLEDDAAQI